MKCVRCQTRPAVQPDTGLCWHCHAADGMKASLDLPLADEPTEFRPGSRGKIDVMAKRAAEGRAAFHPGDDTGGDLG